MDKHDYDPALDSRYSCDKCEDSGIDLETREYCEACHAGARRCNSDKFADMLKGAPYKEAMWTMNQATMKSKQAIAAADKATLVAEQKRLEHLLSETSRIANERFDRYEREMAELRKDAGRYRWLREKRDISHGERNVPWVVALDPGQKIPTMILRTGVELDSAIDCARSAAPLPPVVQEKDGNHE